MPGGTATHKKSDSMPETLFQDFSVAPAKGKEATVSRSHSDSRRRELKVAECGVKVAEEGYKVSVARGVTFMARSTLCMGGNENCEECECEHINQINCLTLWFIILRSQSQGHLYNMYFEYCMLNTVVGVLGNIC